MAGVVGAVRVHCVCVCWKRKDVFGKRNSPPRALPAIRLCVQVFLPNGSRLRFQCDAGGGRDWPLARHTAYSHTSTGNCFILKGQNHEPRLFHLRLK